MFGYGQSDKSLEDPFIRLTGEITYRERYEPQEEDDEPWAVYDP